MKGFIHLQSEILLNIGEVYCFSFDFILLKDNFLFFHLFHNYLFEKESWVLYVLKISRMHIIICKYVLLEYNLDVVNVCIQYVPFYIIIIMCCKKIASVIFLIYECLSFCKQAFDLLTFLLHLHVFLYWSL